MWMSLICFLASGSKVELKDWSRLLTKPIQSLHRCDDPDWLSLVNMSTTWGESIDVNCLIVLCMIIAGTVSFQLGTLTKHPTLMSKWIMYPQTINLTCSKFALVWYMVTCNKVGQIKASSMSVNQCSAKSKAPRPVWEQPWSESGREHRQCCCVTDSASSVEHSPSSQLLQTTPMLVD